MGGTESEAGASGTEGATAERRPERVREAHRRMCALFDACRDAGSARGFRDAALLSVVFGAGAPRATALALPLEAYDADRAVLRWLAAGEGGEPRARRATDGARAAMDDWLEVRGAAAGPLLCRLAGRGEAPRPLAEGTVTSVLRRWGSRPGVDEPDASELARLYTSPWWVDVRGGETRG